LLFLPLCSPDMNPLDLAFSKHECANFFAASGEGQINPEVPSRRRLPLGEPRLGASERHEGAEE